MANFKLDVDADGIALITWDMPGRKPDSGNTETARPASTAAATAPAFELE